MSFPVAGGGSGSNDPVPPSSNKNSESVNQRQTTAELPSTEPAQTQSALEQLNLALLNNASQISTSLPLQQHQQQQMQQQQQQAQTQQQQNRPPNQQPLANSVSPPGTAPSTTGSTQVTMNLSPSALPSTTIDQFAQAFNAVANEGERIIEVSPNGRYAKLNTILGKGAYKVVYKAIDREEGYEVAWNCFQTSRAEFNELSQEIEILKRVRHPNIINFHDCWYNNVEFVFVTELMTSGTLREYIRKLQIPNMKIVKRWSRQILKGLLYLHSHDPPIIHRDIKCDNIFINGAHGEVKIGDMGTAKMKMGKKYTVIGTPEFMAPEMYEEKGYNEKVDVYAFGMCLLEMVTGEYPYSECTNAAQIYKKVTQGLKPDCLTKVSDPEVIDLISRCICTEADRWTVTEVLEHPFLTVEPEVVLLSSADNKTHLTLQVVFKGMDKLSVKFEFNTETDTAEEVVKEMIEENVLQQKYQTLITHEINRILRDLNKITPQQQQTQATQQTQQTAQQQQSKGTDTGHTNHSNNQMPWRRSESMRDELERARREALLANERALEAEKKAELSEVRARLAEDKQKLTAVAEQPMQVQTQPLPSDFPVSAAQAQPSMSHASSGGNLPAAISGMEEIVPLFPVKEYRDDQPIDDLINDTALATNRGPDKASEWLVRLHAQDVMTVGDLRDLHDEDWADLGLTVFASRALRNALHGKSAARITNVSPKTLSKSAALNTPSVAVPAADEHLQHKQDNI